MFKKIKTYKKIKVGIYEDKYDYQVRLIFSDKLNTIEKNDDCRLIYTRSFSELPVALGYYKVLTLLSKESIEQLIATDSN